ncbi:RICIN domain-containing protein [Lentzea aerocolonigenes]|uniref:RICIN domain-containing protein n=1 Tax=Lentzea aerocolonigenes TaxID=68170 RepID=UPI000AF1ADCA|nr:RICIN domain-containing protein [Lentzea aerocolonigenes]
MPSRSTRSWESDDSLGQHGSHRCRPRALITPPAGAATCYNLINHKSGKVASVAGGGSTANGAKIVQWTATGRAEQGWTFDARVIDA